MSTFGEKLRAIRFHLGMSQEELGKLLNTSKQNISRYEKEQNSPRIDNVDAIAKKLGISITFLINDEFSAEEVITAYSKRSQLTPSKTNSTYSPTLVKLVKTAQNLNDEGQGKLSDYADDLDSSGKYSRENSTYTDEKGHIRIKDYQVDEESLPFVASSTSKDEHSSDDELADMVRQMQEEDIERG